MFSMALNAFVVKDSEPSHYSCQHRIRLRHGIRRRLPCTVLAEPVVEVDETLEWRECVPTPRSRSLGYGIMSLLRCRDKL